MDVNIFTTSRIAMRFLFQVCADKASKQLVEEVQTYIDGSELIFASFGKGKELDVFPFLRHFGNSTWKEIQKWSKFQWKIFNAILQNRKVSFSYALISQVRMKIKKVQRLFKTRIECTEILKYVSTTKRDLHINCKIL